MARYRQSDGERVGQKRRLLYGLDGLYDGSDGGDCKRLEFRIICNMCDVKEIDLVY